MQFYRKPSHWMLFSILLILVLTGCVPSSPAPDPDTFTPECNVPDLIKAINDANSTPSTPAEIQLPNNCVYTLTEVDNTVIWQGLSIHSGLPAIISEITFRGNNAVIEILPDVGEAHFGHFFLGVEKKLMLYDLTLKDGARYLGGAVVSNHGDLFAYNVKFLNNMAYPAGMDDVAKGGAIYSYFGKVRILANSLFQDNLAGETLVVGSNLGGAVYSFNSSLLISKSNFIDNFAAGHGGAVYAKNTPANEAGGSIIINNTEFSLNWALQDGGGLYLMDEIEGVFIASSLFYDNLSGGLGGAVFSEDSDVNINFTDFFFNEAEHGGAIYTRRSAAGETSQLLIDHSVLTSNIAATNGGAIFSENSDLELEDGLVSHNLADSCGAIQLGGYPGLDVASGDLETAAQIHSSSKIFSSSIARNQALSGYGGGVCHLMGKLIIRETDFIDNYTPTDGGGLFSIDKLDVFNSTFHGNEANRGGGLAVGFFEKYFIINKSTIDGNTASAEGGGIYLEEGYLYMYNSTLAGNTANRGGGLYNVGDDSELQLTHTTVAYNTATDTGNGSRPGGGGINTKTHIDMRQVLVVLNTNEDCSFGPIKVTGGQSISQDSYHVTVTYGVDSDGTCIILETEENPRIGSFNGTYVPILAGSPLIDIEDQTHELNINVNCYSTEDQIGTSRAQGQYCEPGSIEYDANAPPPPAPPPPPPPLPQATEPPDESAACDPFAGLEISVRLLNINPGTMSLPVYLRFPGPVPDLGGDGTMPYRGTLGSLASFLCNQQGFEDRLYCMFTLQPSTPGTLQDLEIYKENCPEPVFTLPSLTIPEVPNDDQPGSTCQSDLGSSACAEAGGAYMGDEPVPYCYCP